MSWNSTQCGPTINFKILWTAGAEIEKCIIWFFEILYSDWLTSGP